MDLHIPIWLAKGILAVIFLAFFCWLVGRLNEKHKGFAYVIAGLLMFFGCYWLVSLVG